MSSIEKKAEQFAANVSFNTQDPAEVDALRKVLAAGYKRGYAAAAANSAQAFAESIGPAIKRSRAEAWN